MFGLVAQANTAAAFGVENALTAIADPDITIQNGQFIFTGPYRLLAEMAVGASVEFGRYNVAEWNGRGRPNIFAVNRAANPTAPMFFGAYKSQSLMLPQNQQIQSLLTNNLGAGTEAEWLVWKLATADWSANWPPGIYDLIGHATVTVTPAIGSWVENAAIAFDQLPLGGVYVVLGAHCIGANGIAWRLNFPRTRMYMGRRLRPGNVVLPSFGSLPPEFSLNEWGTDGVWGAFHTFELPTFGILGSAAAATTYNIFMKLRFLGESVTLLDNFVQTNY